MSRVSAPKDRLLGWGSPGSRHPRCLHAVLGLTAAHRSPFAARVSCLARERGPGGPGGHRHPKACLLSCVSLCLVFCGRSSLTCPGLLPIGFCLLSPAEFLVPLENSAHCLPGTSDPARRQRGSAFSFPCLLTSVSGRSRRWRSGLALGPATTRVRSGRTRG